MSATQITAEEATLQALAEANEDPDTAALLAPPETTVEDAYADDDPETEFVEVDASDEPAPPDLDAATPAQFVPAPVQVSAIPAMIRHHKGKLYPPDAKRHMSEMGPVCTTNWIGMVKGNRVSVRFGAPLSTIPKDVRAELAKSRIRFAIAAPPEQRGSVQVERTSGAPRARRGNPNGNAEERVRSRFTPIRHLPVE